MECAESDCLLMECAESMVNSNPNLIEPLLTEALPCTSRRRSNIVTLLYLFIGNLLLLPLLLPPVHGTFGSSSSGREIPSVQLPIASIVTASPSETRSALEFVSTSSGVSGLAANHVGEAHDFLEGVADKLTEALADKYLVDATKIFRKSDGKAVATMFDHASSTFRHADVDGTTLGQPGHLAGLSHKFAISDLSSIRERQNLLATTMPRVNLRRTDPRAIVGRLQAPQTSPPDRRHICRSLPGLGGESHALACIVGGFLTGALHAISAPDHMVALLPRCIGSMRWPAAKIGAVWGIGHSISSFLVGAAAFAMLGNSGQLLNTLAQFGELAVGLSFLMIGGLSFAESFEQGLGFGGDAKGCPVLAHEETSDSTSSNNETSAPQPQKKQGVLLNGFLHGLALDGTPALIPALAFGGWRGAFSFLTAYCVGTVGGMTGATLGVAELSQRLSKFTKRPDLILRRLSAGSAVLAIMLGFVFCRRGLAG